MEAVAGCRPFPNAMDKFWTKERTEEFLPSLVACFTVLWVMGVRDRHCDNFLILENGRMFNIDFGFCLGEGPRLDANILPITSDMKNLINKIDDGKKKFRSALEHSLRTVQLHQKRLLDECQAYGTGKEVTQYIKQQLCTVNPASLTAQLNIEAVPEERGDTCLKNFVHRLERNKSFLSAVLAAVFAVFVVVLFSL